MLFASSSNEEAMAQKPIIMEHIKQVLQLSELNVPIKEIARRVGISRNSVKKYLRTFKDQSTTLDTKQLAEIAYNNPLQEGYTLRHFELIQYFRRTHTELKKTGVTRQLLWAEYQTHHENPYGYTQFCHLYRLWCEQSDLAMHLEYNAGDTMMIDFAGDKLHYINPQTGEQISVEVFVAVLPFSGKLFCTAVHSQKSDDFATAINRMLTFYGGVPRTILCDNLRTAVVKSNLYEPVFTELCLQLSEHYQTTFSATRPHEPRDKGMVEKGVQIIYNHVYGPLRHFEFHSIEALNIAIANQLALLNNKDYKNSPYSRNYFFEQHEQQTLGILPSEPYSFKHVRTLTVQRNYHIQLREDGHYYSVPYKYVGKKVQVYYDQQEVAMYYNYERIAVHRRNKYHKAYHTLVEHMPPQHVAMNDQKGWTREQFIDKAKRIGPSVTKAAELILESNFLIEQNFKSCHGMLMLARKYSPQRLEAACDRALSGPRVNYTLIKNILERGLDQVQLIITEAPSIEHPNLRGEGYYQ